MNVVLEDPKAVPYFTDMKATLQAAEIDPLNFEWYLSDLETNFTIDALPIRAGWMTGEEMQRALSKENLQFVWAVFSAFPRGMRFEVNDEPCADGNPRYWSDANLKPQLPGANFEVVSWDSSATLLVCVPEQSGLAFMRKYPQAKVHAAVLEAGDA